MKEFFLHLVILKKTRFAQEEEKKRYLVIISNFPQGPFFSWVYHCCLALAKCFHLYTDRNRKVNLLWAHRVPFWEFEKKNDNMVREYRPTLENIPWWIEHDLDFSLHIPVYQVPVCSEQPEQLYLVALGTEQKYCRRRWLMIDFSFFDIDPVGSNYSALSFWSKDNHTQQLLCVSRNCKADIWYILHS